MKEQPPYMPKPEDIDVLQTSMSVFFERGAGRDDIRNVLRLIEKKDAWGLTEEQVATSSKVLQGLMDRPYLMEDDLQYIVDAFRQEKEVARKDLPRQLWEKQNRLKKIRKNISIGISIASFSIAAYFGVVSLVEWRTNYYSPDAVIAREAADRNKQEQELLKNRKETLGLKPSPISDENWRIRYEPYDPNVDYRETNIEDRLKVGEAKIITFPGKGFLGTGGTSTDIIPYSYKYGDPSQTDFKLHVDSKVGDEKEYALSKSGNEEIDNRVVVFEHTKDDEVDQTRYLSISRMETEGEYYKVIQMKKVPAESVPK